MNQYDYKFITSTGREITITGAKNFDEMEKALKSQLQVGEEVIENQKLEEEKK